MPVQLRSPSGNDDDPIELDDYPDLESFLDAYADQLRDEIAVDGDVEITDDRGVISDGESGYASYEYTDRHSDEETHIELLILRGAPEDEPVVFPFRFG